MISRKETSHSCLRRNPEDRSYHWIPAFAGMTLLMGLWCDVMAVLIKRLKRFGTNPLAPASGERDRERGPFRTPGSGLPPLPVPRWGPGLLSSLKTIVRRRQCDSPPEQEGCPAGTGWSIENDEKTPKRCDFSHGGPSTTPSSGHPSCPGGEFEPPHRRELNSPAPWGRGDANVDVSMASESFISTPVTSHAKRLSWSC